MKMPPPAPSSEGAVIKDVCGIDIGSQSCAGCICRPDKSVVKKRDHLCQCERGLADLGRETEPIGCSYWTDPHWDGSHLPLWENLSHELEQRGYVLRLFHPGQTHHSRPFLETPVFLSGGGKKAPAGALPLFGCCVRIYP
jgi:transposase